MHNQGKFPGEVERVVHAGINALTRHRRLVDVEIEQPIRILQTDHPQSDILQQGDRLEPLKSLEIWGRFRQVPDLRRLTL